MVFLGFKDSFLESVPENKRNIGIPGSATASWRVSLERNRWNIGTSGVQGQLPGECSWKGIGGMSLFLRFRSSFLESVPGKE